MSQQLPAPAYRIRTPRLVLRCWNPADAHLLKEAVESSIDHLRPFMPWAHYEPTTLQQKIDLLRKFRAEFDLGQEYVYGVWNLEETRVLGGCGLHKRGAANVLEIGYWIRHDETRQGYATELSQALVKVAFEVHQVKRVEIRCDPHNVPSAAVPRRLGFTLEGTLRRVIPDHTQQNLTDSMVWGMLAAEYPSSLSASIELQAFDAINRPLL
jgi:RimJ/RimL family protein N-acetyltransferase